MNGDLWRTVRGVLFLDETTFARFKASRNVFARGLLLVVAVALIVGAVDSAVQLGTALTAPPYSVRREQVKQELERAFRSMPQGDPDVEMLQQAMLSWADVGLGIAEDIDQLPTPLPHPAGIVLRAVGRLVSAPLTRLGGWMFFTLVVFAVARLMGGRGTLQEMLGTTALSIVPHIAGVLSPILCLRTLVWVVSGVWGAAIYVKATAVANEIDNGRATLAVCLPVLVPLFLAIVLFTVLALAALTAQ